MKTFKFYPFAGYLLDTILEAAYGESARLVEQSCPKCEHSTCRRRRVEANEINLAIATIKAKKLMELVSEEYHAES